MSKTPQVGLDALLRPDDSILVLIEHQPYRFANPHSHEPTMTINNVIALAKRDVNGRVVGLQASQRLRVRSGASHG